MNLGFVSPLLLWGMLAASLPIIIHLINRRRARKIAFSATYFVKLSNKRLARSLKLKQFLLLLFRTLLLLILPLLLARPYVLPKENNEIVNTETPYARVILLDQSMSMQADYDGKTLFEHALEKTRSLITSFNQADSIGLVFAPYENEKDVGELTFQHHEILEMLDERVATYYPTDFSRSLEKARLMLEGSTLKQRQLIIIGDLTETGYDVPFSMEVEGESVPLAVFDVREGNEISNQSIAAIKTERSFFTGSRDWKVSVSVANYSSRPVTSLPLSVLLNNENVANGFVDIPPDETVTKDFIIKVEGVGRIRLESRIPDDSLKADNKRFAEIDVARNLNVLIVNGQPSTTRHLDEVFYLKEALNPGGMNRSGIFNRVITPDWFMNENLDEYDLVFLCHIPKISEEMGLEIERFVSEGHGVFITVGPNVDVDNYNETIGGLLPGTLRGERLAGTGTESKSQGRVVYLSHLDYANPAFRVFNDETAKSLYLAKVKKYLTFDSDASRKKQILARFSDTSPALVEVQYGQGKSMLFTSSISRVWNDIPIQPGFLPLMQELAHLLAGGSKDDGKQSFLVGDRYQVQADYKVSKIVSPSGNEIKPKNLEDGNRMFGPFLESGFYTLDSNGDDFVTVNVTTSESDLKPLSEKNRESVFGSFATPKNINASVVAGEKIEYTGYLIWILLLLFMGEILVLRWMR